MKIVLETEKLNELAPVLGMSLAFNASGEIVYSSEELKKKFLYDEDIVGMHIKTLFPALLNNIEDFEELFSILKDEKQVNAYRKNGTIFPVHLTMCRFEKSTYIVRVHDDTSEVKWKQRYERAEIDAKAALSKQNEFVANVTHELRTPVNGIKGNVKFLKEQGNLTKVQDETLDIVTRCCHNMEKIINNLLDFAKLDAGKITIDIEKFSFRDMMKHAYDTNAKQAAQKGISLQVNYDESIPDELYGDALRIGQILNNYISNAVKFTSVGSVRVEAVEVARTDKNIELFFMVIDTGIGIAKENIDKLFKSFSQVDGSITRNYGGTGLGLAITKQLVQMMNGSIKVESELGKGSTFAFSVVIGLTPDIGEESTEESETNDNINRTESIQNKFDSIINRVEREDVSNVFKWGTKENRAEIKDTLSKLVLCIEMGNFEKAEVFSDKVKKLCEGGGMEFMKQIFRLQLALRKSDHEQSMQEYNVFLDIFNKE
ncbi:MAG: PAS domain-containing protein [Lachnospiraceae bacterium]|nr:PAS domain-containing protein [Lachnospiraceae bacterium]